MRRVSLPLIAAVLLLLWATTASEPGEIFQGPSESKEEKYSEDYQVFIAGRPVPVYSCRVSAVPFNQVWPGYQRPQDQTELASFASWDMAQPVDVVVQSLRPANSAVLRPASLNLQPQIQGNRIAFHLRRPVPVVVEVNGWHKALHLFASPPETQVPKPDEERLHFYGPGVHRPGRITLRSNEQIYIAPGAVVHGSIQARGAKNIAIRGRGILDVSSFERGQGGGAIRLVDCEKIIIEGIVMRDPDVWCCTLLGCRDATIDNVKLIGLWRYNADGIDICNSQDVVIRNCFVRSFDDSLVLKGLKSARRSFDDRPVQNVCATGCVIWNDWGRALEIGAETCAPSISQVVFEDCDIIRTTHIAMDIQHGDRAVINNVTFRNIRVEIDEENLPPRMQARREEKYQEKATRAYSPKLLEIVIRPTPYSRDDRPGTVRDVLLDNINVRCKLVPPSHLLGFNAENDVRGVKITGLRIGGRSVASLEEARVTVGPHVKNLTIKSVP